MGEPQASPWAGIRGREPSWLARALAARHGPPLPHGGGSGRGTPPPFAGPFGVPEGVRVGSSAVLENIWDFQNRISFNRLLLRR